MTRRSKLTLALRWSLLGFGALMGLWTRPPLADPDPYYGLMLAMAVYLAVSVFWTLDDDAVLQRCMLAFTEVVLVTALISLSGGLRSPYFILYVAGAALASAEHGSLAGLLYAVVGVLGYLGPTVVMGDFQLKGGMDYVTRVLVLLWVGALGFIPRGELVDHEEEHHMGQLDQALYTARMETQARQTKEQELYAERRKLEALIEVSYRLAVIRRLEDLLTNIVEVATDQLQVQVAAVMFIRDGHVTVMQSNGLPDMMTTAMRSRVGTGLFGQLIQTDRSFRYSHVDGRAPLTGFGELGPFESLLPSSARLGTSRGFQTGAQELRNFLVVPLRSPTDRGPFGLLVVGNLLVGEAFTDAHDGYMRILATYAAITIRNIQARVELERSHYEMIQALAQAIEAKDPYTHGHVARVRNYSVRLARAMGLAPEVVRDVDTAAILHDVGKISTPDEILRKPGALTDAEFETMKEHAANSLVILRDIRSVSPEVQRMVLHHHERWDGKGYPARLAGNDIPLGAQIISVADCYDAMTSDRPYRKGFAPNEALKRMENGFGSQFNGLILAYFFAMFEYVPQDNQEAARTTDEVRRRVQENLLRTYPAARIPVRMGVGGSAATDPGSYVASETVIVPAEGVSQPTKKFIQFDAK